MKDHLKLAKSYSLVILRKTEKRKEPEADKIVWEHGRRNFQLIEQGLASIVCPINDGSEYSGIKILNVPISEAIKIMDEDEGVKAGIFTYEVHACLGFPGSTLA